MVLLARPRARLHDLAHRTWQWRRLTWGPPSTEYRSTAFLVAGCSCLSCVCSAIATGAAMRLADAHRQTFESKPERRAARKPQIVPPEAISIGHSETTPRRACDPV